TRAGAFVYANNRFQAISGTENTGITAIATDGEVLLGTDTGMVLRVSGAQNGVHSAAAVFTEPIKTSDGEAARITGLVLQSDEIFASTAGRGIFRIRDGRAEELPIKLRNQVVNAIALTLSGPQSFLIGTDA